MSIAIVAWRKLSRRSTLLAQALGSELLFFKDRLPYLRAIWRTHFAVREIKPKILIVQLPQGPLLLQALFLRWLFGCKIVADVHTGFLLTEDWKGLLLNRPFKPLLGSADLILAHNETQLMLIPKKLQPKTIVVYDQWQFCIPEPSPQATEGDYLVFPASFSPDEPLKQVIQTVEASETHLKLYVTGNWKRQPQIREHVSDRVIFTGFLPDPEFNRLVAGARAVITGTKREYTSLMSAWEAVANAKSLALTKTETLQNLFGEYAVFFDWTKTESIHKAIQTVLSASPNYTEREKLKKTTLKSLQILNIRLSDLTNPASVKNTV